MLWTYDENSHIMNGVSSHTYSKEEFNMKSYVALYLIDLEPQYMVDIKVQPLFMTYQDLL